MKTNIPGIFAAGDITASYIGPKVLSITHILVLGWITMIIFGALYQLIPVVMEVRLYSESLAHVSLYSLFTGTVLMAISFWKHYTEFNLFMQIGSTFVFISVLLFIINTVMSARKTKQYTIENTFIVTSGVWLMLTVLIGLFMLLNTKIHLIGKSNIELLKIHAHFGIAGWFLMLVTGVGSTLLPMFFIAHQLNKNYLKISYVLINIGLIALAVSFYTDAPQYLIIISGLILIVGLIFFVKYNFDAYKKRIRRKLDIGMKLSTFSFLLLFLTLFLGILTAINPEFLKEYSMKLGLIYGISLILGFLTSLILGQMYKTLPFIIWLVRYQDKVGKYEIPMPASLYSMKVANAHYYSFLAGFISLFVGILISSEIVIKIGAFAYTVTAVLYLYNTLKVVLHKTKLKELGKE